MLYIEKIGVSQRALNQIKRLAAFKNPEFYKAQAIESGVKVYNGGGADFEEHGKNTYWAKGRVYRYCQ